MNEDEESGIGRDDFRSDTPDGPSSGNASIRVKLPPSTSIDSSSHTTTSPAAIATPASPSLPSVQSTTPPRYPSLHTTVSPRRSSSSPCLPALSSISLISQKGQRSVHASAQARQTAYSSATTYSDDATASSSRLARIRSASSALTSMASTQNRNTSFDPLAYEDPLLSSSGVKSYLSLALFKNDETKETVTKSRKDDLDFGSTSTWLGSDFPGCDDSGCDLECSFTSTEKREPISSSSYEESFFNDTTASGTSEDANDADRSEVDDVFFSTLKDIGRGKGSLLFNRMSQTIPERRQQQMLEERLKDDDEVADDDEDFPLSHLLATTQLRDVCEEAGDERKDDDWMGVPSNKRGILKLAPNSTDAVLSDSSASIWNDEEDEEDQTIQARRKIRFIGTSPFPRPPAKVKASIQNPVKTASTSVLPLQYRVAPMEDGASRFAPQSDLPICKSDCCRGHHLVPQSDAQETKKGPPPVHKSIWSVSSPVTTPSSGKKGAFDLPPILKSRKSTGQMHDHFTNLCYADIPQEPESPSLLRSMSLRRAGSSHLHTESHSPLEYKDPMPYGLMHNHVQHSCQTQHTNYGHAGEYEIQNEFQGSTCGHFYPVEDGMKQRYYRSSPVHLQMQMQMRGPLGPSPNNKKGELYKTEMCRSWCETGSCRYAEKCQFAHGIQELRTPPYYGYSCGATFDHAGHPPHSIASYDPTTGPYSSYFPHHFALDSVPASTYAYGDGIYDRHPSSTSSHKTALWNDNLSVIARKRADSVYVGHEYSSMLEVRRRSVSSPSRVRLYASAGAPQATQYRTWPASAPVGFDEDEDDLDDPLVSPFTPITPHCYSNAMDGHPEENHHVTMKLYDHEQSDCTLPHRKSKCLKKLSHDEKLFAALQAEAAFAPIPSRNFYQYV